MNRWLRPLGLVLALALAFAPFAWEHWWIPPVSQAEAQLYQTGKTLQSAATATGNGNTIDTSLTSIIAMQIIGTFVGTIVPEGSLDGTNWATLTCYALGSSSAKTSFTSADTNTIVRCNTIGIPLVRARISVYTSGSITVLAQAVASYFPLGTTTP